MFGIVIMTKKAYDKREELLANAMELNERIMKDWSEAIDLNEKMSKFNNKLCDFNTTLVTHIDERDNALCVMTRDILRHEERLSRIENIAACRSGVTVDEFKEH